MPAYLHSGQRLCYDPQGRVIDCAGTRQDGELLPGLAWPSPRFRSGQGVVEDRLTGLTWLAEANRAQFPLSWQEALDWVAEANQEGLFGSSDWRLPNRRELLSLISYQDLNPALPQGHPFQDVFLGWYWTSTTAAINPAFAWYVHLEGGRMFYGRKDQYYMVWPVRGASPVLAATGQEGCFASDGSPRACPGSGEDGELRLGLAWPRPRFEVGDQVVRDRLTGLHWLRRADLAPGPVTWARALDLAAGLDQEAPGGRTGWRLPSITELESLADASRHSPALPEGHPFEDWQEAYWSSTSSAFDPTWCMAFYLHKGAVGVGQKAGAHFAVWAVSS